MQNSSPTRRERVGTGVSLWLSRLKNPELAKGLALLILLLSSTQLGYHFWPNSAFVYGARIDYLSPTLYLLDVLIIIYFVIQSLRKQQRLFKIHYSLFAVLLVNILFTNNFPATLSWSLHILLYLLFILSLSSYFIRHTVYRILPIAMFFQVALGVVQVALGRTVQGPFYYLGERALSVGAPNVARGEFFGHLVLRAYGTFGHPNALAGWLVIALLITIYLRKHHQSSVGLTLKDSSRLDLKNISKRSDPIGYPWIWISLAFTALGVFLTQSRSAALAIFGIVIPFYLLRSLRSRLLYFVLCSMFYVLCSNIFSRPLDTSLTDRLSLQQLSFNITRAFPIFGTGANASISTYSTISPNSRLLQPDHNSFTLFLSWFGLFGTLTFLYFLRSHLVRCSLFIIPLLPLLLFDHYLLTSPQGLFILLLYLRVTIFP